MTSGIWEGVKERRSVRIYRLEEVPTCVLRRILEAARWAPSAHNAQPWRFVVLQEHRNKRRLAEAMAQAWDRDLKDDGVPAKLRDGLITESIERFSSPPIVVIVCKTMEDMESYPDERRLRAEHTMAVQSVAVSIQNMLLASHGEGVGACWFCAPLFCPDVVRETLGIPDGVEPQALITMGRPAERPGPPPRKALESLVHYERW